MSVGGSVARRYARALLEIGLETERLEEMVEHVGRVAQAIESSRELRDVLRNPLVLISQRKKVLDVLATRLAVSRHVRNTCLLLVERGRAEVLPAIARELRRMVDEHQGVLRAEVISAEPMSKPSLDSLVAALGRATGKKIEVTASHDAGLIGGVVTRVGGMVYDGSLRTRLARVREEMLD
jgi:F-type H+-transporting ATPase subunit delta